MYFIVSRQTVLHFIAQYTTMYSKPVPKIITFRGIKNEMLSWEYKAQNGKFKLIDSYTTFTKNASRANRLANQSKPKFEPNDLWSKHKLVVKLRPTTHCKTLAEK